MNLILPPPAASSAVYRLDEAGAFSRALLGGEFEFLPMPGAEFHGTLRLLHVGDLMVQHAEIGPHASRSALSAGLEMLLLPLRHAATPPSVNGAAVLENNALIVPGGTEFHCYCTGSHEWAALALPPGLLEAAAEFALPPGDRHGAVRQLGLQGGPLRRLAGALSTAAALADNLPEAALTPGCAAGLAMALQDLVTVALTAGADARSTPRAGREAQRVVLRAEEFLFSHLDRPIYMLELCDALAISARKLHNAFLATVGLSPHAYLKARRLAIVRRTLQRGTADVRRVKSVALAHGFWHLGHFAQDYRRMFSEVPSETLARAHGRSNAPEGA
jgi:AraC-like DNA-binding protein